MPLTFAETPLYYKDSQGQYHRVLSGADMTGYRTAAAQDAIDAAQDEQIEAISHRNLLDNWYFVGGGSQLGAGIFPINQQGQTVYASGYGIDRWKISSSPLRLTAKESGIELQRVSATSSPHFSQKLSQEAPAGVYTASLLYKASLAEGDFVSIVALDNGSGLILGTIDNSKADWTLASFTFTVTGSMTDFRIQFIVDSTQVDDAIELAALKLERGSYQTLAHEINGEWVLNEIPDYGEELAKCQRYYIKFDRYIASGFLTNSGKEYNIPIYLPITMAGTPTVTMSGYVARTQNGYSAHTGGSWTAPESLRAYYPNNGFVLLADTIASAVDTNNIQINYYIKDLVLTV